MSLAPFGGTDPASLALDLGTAFTRICRTPAGPITDAPSRVATTRLLRRGVVIDVEAAARLLEPLIWRERQLGWRKPVVLACAPSDATPDEIESLCEATRRAGARGVRVVPEPLAAGLGAGIDPKSRYAQLVLDVGDGVTDAALVREGRLLDHWTRRVACGDIRQAVRSLARRHHVRLAAAAADQLAGQAMDPARPGAGPLRRAELQRVVEPAVDAIAGVLRRAWRELSAADSCEVIESGVLLCGGGALLPGLRERLMAETRLDVHLAPDPLHAVILGARRLALAS